MNSTKRLLAAAMATVLLLSAVASAGVARGTAANDAVANDALAVDVSQAGNDVTVSVTSNGSAVDGANVTVEVTDENITYAGAGEHTTGENGTVELDAPEENVTVAVTATDDNQTASTTATLTAAEGGEGDDEPRTFGQRVSAFVHDMLTSGNDDGPLGQVVSEFVTSNNPGNAPDHAGGPGEKGESGDAGKPADVGPKNATDDDRGPPEHAGQDDGDDEKDEEDGGDDEDDDDDKRGNGKKKGHDKGKKK